MCKLFLRFILLAGLLLVACVACKPKATIPNPNMSPSPTATAQSEPNLSVSTATGPTDINSPHAPTAEVPGPLATEPGIASSNTNLNDKAASQTQSDDETSAKVGMAMAPAKPANWTSQRLVLMGNGGPRFVKFDVNVAGEDLAHGFQLAMSNLARELSIDFANPPAWNTLLDDPVIASGWLGNLVPSTEQREQLRALYDTNKNEKVDEPEFRAFLTRGLSRNAPLRVVSRSTSAPRLASNSVWGPVDKDESGDLNSEELARTTQTMLRFDFDGDRILTPAELRAATDGDGTMANNGPSRLLDMTSVHLWELDKPDGMVRAVFDNYAFSDTISSDLLFAWTPSRFNQFDIDADGGIDRKELKAITDQAVDSTFQLSFPDLTGSASEKLSVNFGSIDPALNRKWSSHPEGGRLVLDGCIVTIVLIDEQSAAVRDAFSAQYGRIEKDAQLQSFAMQALELKEGALETLKKRAEDQQSDPGQLAWRWLVTPRHWQVQIGWSTSDSPWFELMDLNGDQKLVVAELDQFAAQALGWDRNKDGSIVADEMPISVLLEVKRAEARGLGSRLGGTSVEKRGAIVGSAPTWFTGMDYNSDGELSQSEFLGDQSDFEKLDLDRDGIIEVREVSTPQ